MTSSEIKKLGISECDFKRTGIHSKNILGAIPSLLQPNDPVCTWIVWEIKDNLANLIQTLKSGSRIQLKEFQEIHHAKAIDKFHIQRLRALNNCKTDDSKQQTANASREASRNIFKNNCDLLYFTKKSWTERVSKSLGGNPELQRKEIKIFLEKALQPNNFVMVTRCNHSYIYIVIGSGLVLIYDTIFPHIFLVSLEGAFQHFFRNESIGEKDCELFDENDVYIAYQNFVENHNICKFSYLDSAILMSQLRKDSIIVKFEFSQTLYEDFIFCPDSN